MSGVYRAGGRRSADVYREDPSITVDMKCTLLIEYNNALHFGFPQNLLPCRGLFSKMCKVIAMLSRLRAVHYQYDLAQMGILKSKQ